MATWSDITEIEDPDTGVCALIRDYMAANVTVTYKGESPTILSARDSELEGYDFILCSESDIEYDFDFANKRAGRKHYDVSLELEIIIASHRTTMQEASAEVTSMTSTLINFLQDTPGIGSGIATLALRVDKIEPDSGVVAENLSVKTNSITLVTGNPLRLT